MFSAIPSRPALRSKATALSLLLALYSLPLVGCGEEEPEVPDAPAPDVGLYDIPISRSNEGSLPSDAVQLVVSQSHIWLGDDVVLDMERGAVPEASLSDDVITPLREALAQSPARARAAVRMHAMVPYVTLARVLHTLERAGMHEVHFAVRTLGEDSSEGWMLLSDVRVIPSGNETPEFEGAGLPWTAFTENWPALYTACRAGRYVDCDSVLSPVAEGGELLVTLWTRGQGMKLTFSQINAPEGAETAGGGGGGAEMIEGIAAAPAPAAGEGEAEPVTEASFTLRQQEATNPESAISATIRPICANQTCQVLVYTDASAPTMRVLSMLGAAFPNGFRPPNLVFRLPE